MQQPAALLLLFLFATAVLATDPRMPYFEARGDHYSVGFQIGQRFKEQIQTRFGTQISHFFWSVKFFTGADPYLQKALGFVQTKSGQKEYSLLLNAARQSFPDYVEELQGLSDGSGSSFDSSEIALCSAPSHFMRAVMVANLLDELSPTINLRRREKCSDIFLTSVSSCRPFG